jgi:hypothetical protein
VSQDASGQSLQSKVGDHIRQRFRFLEPLGFGAVGSGEGFARWQREERSITLSHDWRDGYLDLTFRIESPNAAQGVFGLKHALEVIGATDVMPSHDWAAWELEPATRYVDELASIIENHLLAFLEGDAGPWMQVPASHPSRPARIGKKTRPDECATRLTRRGKQTIGTPSSATTERFRTRVSL